MIPFRWQGPAANFGDELNTVLWPPLLPGFFDDNTDTRFVGIGSVLDGRHPADTLKVVAGAGYGGYEARPVIDHTWTIHWVRGPHTAAVLGLPAGLALGDPALLLPLVLPPRPAAAASGIGFMPHFESIARGAWQQAAAIAGLTLIDPRDPPLLVLDAIRRCKLLLSEAMHGVIAADALRVPWVAVRPLAVIHRAKWRDWSDQMNLALRPQALPASSAAEWLGACRTTRWQRTGAWMQDHHALFHRLAAAPMVNRAAAALREAARAEPQLSTDASLDRCQSRMMDALTGLRLRPVFSRLLHHDVAADLLHHGEFDYQISLGG